MLRLIENESFNTSYRLVCFTGQRKIRFGKVYFLEHHFSGIQRDDDVTPDVALFF
jgi:hypothetical protein